LLGISGIRRPEAGFVAASPQSWAKFPVEFPVE